MPELALVVPSQPAGQRACYACVHYQIRGTDAYCCHPRYRVPTRWLTAIERGQPCGEDNAPLWEARPALPGGGAHG